MRSRARSEYFYARAVRVQLHTRAFLKFKSSCTVVVKVPCKLLYVIQVKEFLIECSTSWPYLISEFLVAYITIVASDWPRTFFTPKVFCLASNLQAVPFRSFCLFLPTTA